MSSQSRQTHSIRLDSVPLFFQSILLNSGFIAVWSNQKSKNKTKKIHTHMKLKCTLTFWSCLMLYKLWWFLLFVLNSTPLVLKLREKKFTPYWTHGKHTQSISKTRRFSIGKSRTTWIFHFVLIARYFKNVVGIWLNRFVFVCTFWIVNTHYSKKIQNKIIDKFKLHNFSFNWLIWTTFSFNYIRSYFVSHSLFFLCLVRSLSCSFPRFRFVRIYVSFNVSTVKIINPLQMSFFPCDFPKYAFPQMTSNKSILSVRCLRIFSNFDIQFEIYINS